MTSPCFNTYMAGYSTALDCVKDKDHDGPHRSYAGSEWE